MEGVVGISGSADAYIHVVATQNSLQAVVGGGPQKRYKFGSNVSSCVATRNVRKLDLLQIAEATNQLNLLKHRTKWCELREHKWNEFVTIAANRNLSNCEITRKKVFRGFNGIRTRGPCASAAVLSQLSYEDPYTESRPILLSSSTRERNETQNEMMRTAGTQMKWVCDHRSESQFKQLRNSPKKRFFGGLQRDSNPWPLRQRRSVPPAWAMKTHTLRAGQFYWVHQPVKGMKHRTKWRELREHKWNEYVTIAVNRNLSKKKNNKKLFFGLFRNCLNCDSLRWSHTHFINLLSLYRNSFHLCSRSSHHFVLCFIPFTGWWTQ